MNMPLLVSRLVFLYLLAVSISILIACVGSVVKSIQSHRIFYGLVCTSIYLNKFLPSSVVTGSEVCIHNYVSLLIATEAFPYILLNGLTYNPAKYFTSFERIFQSPAYGDEKYNRNLF